MDLGLLYKALEQGQVSMVAGNATDGQLSVLDALVLQDDHVISSVRLWLGRASLTY